VAVVVVVLTKLEELLVQVELNQEMMEQQIQELGVEVLGQLEEQEQVDLEVQVL
jgi:hypothetical protein